MRGVSRTAQSDECGPKQQDFNQESKAGDWQWHQILK